MKVEQRVAGLERRRKCKWWAGVVLAVLISVLAAFYMVLDAANSAFCYTKDVVRRHELQMKHNSEHKAQRDDRD
jgi:hypothetical protein